MGWHEDFFAEAVKEDLGKSGIKVAETVEIEGPSEWYRLISSASPATVRGYTSRIFPEPVIQEGSFDLGFVLSEPFYTQGSGIASAIDPQSHTIADIMNKELVNKFMIFEDVEGVLTPRIVTIYKVARSGTSYYDTYVRVHNLDGTERHTFNVFQASDSSSYVILTGFWDHTNQRIIFSKGYWTGVKQAVYGVLGNSSLVNAGNTGVFTVSNLHEVQVFPECPEKIYSLFLGASVVVKTTTPTLGQSATSVTASVISTGDGVTVSVASNYRSGEAFLFYSRTHESIGLVWVDATNGRLYYALESEEWVDAYLLSSAFASRGEILKYFGNLVLSGTEEGGEYYVAGTTKLPTGIIQRPAGYSYPENLSLMGLARSSSGHFKIFGRIGATCYVFGVNRSTKEIISQDSVDLGFSINSDYAPIKVAESEDRELFLLCRFSAGYAQRSILVNMDKSTGLIVWVWGQDEDHWAGALSPFPHISASTRSSLVFRIKDELFLWGLELKKSDHRWVSVNSVLDCETADAFDVLLREQTLFYTADIFSRVFGTSGNMVGPQIYIPTQVVSYGETVDSVFFVVANGRNNNYMTVFHLSKSTKDFLSAAATSSAGYGFGYVGSILAPDYEGYDYNMAGATDPDSEQGIKNIYLWWNANNLRVFENSVTSSVGGALLSSFFDNYKGFGFVTGLYGVSYAILYLPGDTTIYPVIFNRNVSHPSQSRLQRTIALSHSARHVLVNEFEDYILVLDNISSGDIAYTEVRGMELDDSQGIVIKATDFNETYSLDKGFASIGGVMVASFKGSYALYSDFANRTWAIATGAQIDDFVGGISPIEGVSGNYIYQYYDYQFIPYPFAREGIRAELSNISKTTQITLPETQTHFIKGLLAGGFDPRGARCILRRIFPDYMAEEGGSIILLDGYIQEWAYSPSKEGIIFTVSKTLLDVGNAFPKRLMNMGCGHVFKGDRCQYAGATGLCSKTKTFCTSLGNVNQFGGFPWVAVRQRRVMWR